MQLLRRNLIIGTALGSASAILHLLPFFLYSANPLGYDTGFYRRYLTQLFLSFPNASVPGLGNDALVPRFLLDVLRLTHLSPDLILYGTYIAFFAAMPVLLFILLRTKLGERGALFGAALLIVSSVDYNGYWYLLYKNALALDLLLAAFIALEKRSVFALIALDILIALTHKTTAIIYLVTLGIFFLYARGRRRETLLHIGVTAVAFLFVNFSLIHEVTVAEPSALFIEWGTYIVLSLPLIAVIIIGWRGMSLGKFPSVWPAFAISSFLFPIFHLPFYERIFLFSDIALIGFAACGAEYLFMKAYPNTEGRFAYFASGVLLMVIGFSFGNLWGQVNVLSPLMSDSDIAQIASAGTLVPVNATILTTSDEAPWYEGWTSSHIAAPGLLHDDHNLDAWNAFWDSTSTTARTAFLDSFDKPLYISTLGSFDDLIGPSLPCLSQITPYLLKDDCVVAPNP